MLQSFENPIVNRRKAAKSALTASKALDSHTLLRISIRKNLQETEKTLPDMSRACAAIPEAAYRIGEDSFDTGE